MVDVRAAVVHESAGPWPDADKVVHSSPLTEVSTTRTRIEYDVTSSCLTTGDFDNRVA